MMHRLSSVPFFGFRGFQWARPFCSNSGDIYQRFAESLRQLNKEEKREAFRKLEAKDLTGLDEILKKSVGRTPTVPADPTWEQLRLQTIQKIKERHGEGNV